MKKSFPYSRLSIGPFQNISTSTKSYKDVISLLEYTYNMYTYCNMKITFSFYSSKKFLVTPVIFNEGISINYIIQIYNEYLNLAYKSKSGLIKFFNKNGISCKLKINKSKKSKILSL